MEVNIGVSVSMFRELTSQMFLKKKLACFILRVWHHCLAEPSLFYTEMHYSAVIFVFLFVWTWINNYCLILYYLEKDSGGIMMFYLGSLIRKLDTTIKSPKPRIRYVADEVSK